MKRVNANSLIKETLVVVTIALLLSLLVRGSLVEVFWIPSGSMEPTLVEDDRVVVLRTAAIDRGDVIVFKPPPAPGATEAHYIKRAIGLPGDVVELIDGQVHVNGTKLTEPYARLDQATYGPTTVPTGHVFFLGDNRADSNDSREIGTVPLNDVVGEAVAVVWPFTHAAAGLTAAPAHAATR